MSSPTPSPLSVKGLAAGNAVELHLPVPPYILAAIVSGAASASHLLTLPLLLPLLLRTRLPLATPVTLQLGD